MKDLSNYSYVELYDMLSHINPYKYEDKLLAVQNELDSRKQRGEVPTDVIPKIIVHKEDYLLVAKSIGQLLYCIILGLIGFVLVNTLLAEGIFNNYQDYLLAFNTIVIAFALIELFFFGKIKYLRIIFPIYLIASLATYVILFGFDTLALP